jgi:hypothetical protein
MRAAVVFRPLSLAADISQNFRDKFPEKAKQEREKDKE